MRPADTARAMARMGLPSARPLVRLGGAAEVAVGSAALLVGGRLTSALVAASYLAFSIVVAFALRSGDPLSSCGCFGRPDTPPTRVHLAVTGLLALAAAVAVLRPPKALLDDVLSAPGTGVPLLLLAALGTGLSWLVLAVLPTLSAPIATVRTLSLVPSSEVPS